MIDDYNRQCRGKKPLRNGAKAKFVAAVMSERHGASFSRYRCPFCRAWHVGHTPVWRDAR